MRALPLAAVLIALAASAVSCHPLPPSAQAAGPDDEATAELLALADADQAARSEDLTGLDASEIASIRRADAARRERVLELLADDRVHGTDALSSAALVLQHGGEPRDYLVAHVLASAAAFDGDEDARWLAAASLDRFLQSIDRPQLFGTQLRKPSADAAWTLEPYDRSLPDSLLELYGVAPRDAQEQRVESMNAPE